MMKTPNSPMRQRLKEPGGVAEQLTKLRKDANLSVGQLAKKAGILRPKISKLGLGDQCPTDADLRSWAEACGQPSAFDGLAELVKQVQEELDSGRQRRSRASTKDRQYPLEQTASTASYFSITSVPWPLQTSDYMRSGLMRTLGESGPPDDVNELVAHRLAHQEQVLYKAKVRLEFLLWEPVLTNAAFGVQELAVQIDRLHSAIGLPHMRFGILPSNRPVQMAPRSSFTLIDDTAIVELPVGEVTFGGHEATMYQAVLRRLWVDAVEGEAAREYLNRAVIANRDLNAPVRNLPPTELPGEDMPGPRGG